MTKYVNIGDVINAQPLRIEDDKDDKPVDKCFNAGWNTASSEFIKSIDELPTINVVRCKDCKFGHYDPDVGDYDCNKTGRWMSHNGDWFCADGRMKGEEE